MEVHAPHDPLNTWREFWIHLGTITVGLLIALGLEQTAEYAHRVHEKHALQRELHDEGEHNEEALRMDFARMAALKNSLVSWHRGVDEAIAKGGGLSDPPNRNTTTGTVPLPSQAMWDSAKATGRVALLSDEQTAVYSFLYQQEEPAEGAGEGSGDCRGREAGAGAKVRGELREDGKGRRAGLLEDGRRGPEELLRGAEPGDC